jgi:hypothetical protein
VERQEISLAMEHSLLELLTGPYAWLLVIGAGVPYFGRLILSKLRFSLCPGSSAGTALDQPLILAGQASSSTNYPTHGIRVEGKTFEATFSKHALIGLRVTTHMPLTIFRVAALNGKDDRIASDDTIVKKGDVIESVNGEDLRKLANVKDAVAKVRTHLEGKEEVVLKILAARVFDKSFDMGVQGFTYASNYYTLDQSVHKHDDSPWQRFATNIRVAGWSKRVAYSLAAFRLFFWHWLQPALYWLILYSYWDTLQGQGDDNLQLRLALAVGVREAIYFPITLLALVYNPSFLLIDLTFRHDRVLQMDAVANETMMNSAIWMSYGLTPEKLVLTMALTHLLKDAGGIDCLGMGDGAVLSLSLTLLAVIFLGFDMCAIAAFAVGLQYHNLPHALAVGYGLTTLSGLIALPPTLIGILAFGTALVSSCAGSLARCCGYNQRRSRDQTNDCISRFCSCCFDCFESSAGRDTARGLSAWDDKQSFIYTRHRWRSGYPHHAAYHSLVEVETVAPTDIVIRVHDHSNCHRMPTHYIALVPPNASKYADNRPTTPKWGLDLGFDSESNPCEHEGHRSPPVCALKIDRGSGNAGDGEGDIHHDGDIDHDGDIHHDGDYFF